MVYLLILQVSVYPLLHHQYLLDCMNLVVTAIVLNVDYLNDTLCERRAISLIVWDHSLFEVNH